MVADFPRLLPDATKLAEEIDTRLLQGNPDFERFCAAAREGNLVPVYERVFSDRITPVLAYRALVQAGDNVAPSFLLESVNNGDQQGRYSFVGAWPALEVIATKHEVTVVDHLRHERTVTTEADPLGVAERIGQNWKPVAVAGLPREFTGGWVGYCGYDTVRYTYESKLPFRQAPPDTDGLPDLHLALYNEVVAFDQATKLAYICAWLHLEDFPTLEAAYLQGQRRLQALSHALESVDAACLSAGKATLALTQRPKRPEHSNMTRESFLKAVDVVREHILAGDVFQLVLSQRFQRHTFADPFEIYRALRVVNPSPYMLYMQVRGSILVASSPEILCRVGHDRTVTNRPLAGTRRRGDTEEADLALEKELLADEKERAEHVMLVDLGRNDVGKVAEAGSVAVQSLMEVERYSHVMHISSTVTGKLKQNLTSWDALRAALPVGTVSGAPKVRAMQIIDELETTKRGPYGGGIGVVGFNGAMDIALALRTMVIPVAAGECFFQYNGGQKRREWLVHLQAGAGLVADSVPEMDLCPCKSKPGPLHSVQCLAKPLDGSFRASRTAPLRRWGRSLSSQRVRAESSSDHVFGEKGYMAGIPMSSSHSASGARLRNTLLNRPHEFVALAVQELEDVVKELLNLVAAGGEVSTASSQAEVFQDVIYHWALAEAYLPQMDSYMRAALGRSPSSRPLAAGDDGMLLASRVQLLNSPQYEGQYMIGSVRFNREAPSPSAQPEDAMQTIKGMSEGLSSVSRGQLHWGGSPSTSWLKGGELQPALEAVFGSERARFMTSVQGDALSRMDRESAARTFHTFIEQPIPLAPPARSDYGDIAPVWRFFEQVPGHISSPRTVQAKEVATRHLRALFGSSSECITTLQAWQHMCIEARWFGRALYDAEQLVMATCRQCAAPDGDPPPSLESTG
ncbi:hypothetical protein WJX73_006210 [Symbiochloris irregularis]|uniref:anthranilate synthase n=1 Tax=Symbiochloris irregularis TaxID=706552 RepID=A0AAW1NTX8_9CHLO